MREIKFRAWQKYHKEMLEVINLTFNKGKITSLTVRYGENYGNISQIYSEISKDFGLYEDGKMILELMQYTGLKDKTHLKDIVFGDVVIVDSPKGPFKAKITQEVGAFGIVAIDGQIIDYFEDNWNDDFMALLDIYWNFNNDDNVIEEIEVIGNIYENPELLEVRNG